MRIAVLCDGAGLARLGLEQAGHECTGVELNPWKHYLSERLGSGRCILGDATTFNLSEFEGAWVSTPCTTRSVTLMGNLSEGEFKTDLLDWALGLHQANPHLKSIWIENVALNDSRFNTWGKLYNAAQFTFKPLQCRNRIIGGVYPEPRVYRPYTRAMPRVCPAITATEYRGYGSRDRARASRFYGRRLTIQECAYHQGLELPEAWLKRPPEFSRVDHRDKKLRATDSLWQTELYEAIGNGVPVYMAYQFGLAAKELEEVL